MRPDLEPSPAAGARPPAGSVASAIETALERIDVGALPLTRRLLQLALTVLAEEAPRAPH